MHIVNVEKLKICTVKWTLDCQEKCYFFFETFSKYIYFCNTKLSISTKKRGIIIQEVTSFLFSVSSSLPSSVL